MIDIDDDRPLGVERGADVAAGLRREAQASAKPSIWTL
jgi:hypothetical protein